MVKEVGALGRFKGLATRRPGMPFEVRLFERRKEVVKIMLDGIVSLPGKNNTLIEGYAGRKGVQKIDIRGLRRKIEPESR